MGVCAVPSLAQVFGGGVSSKPADWLASSLGSGQAKPGEVSLIGPGCKCLRHRGQGAGRSNRLALVLQAACALVDLTDQFTSTTAGFVVTDTCLPTFLPRAFFPAGQWP